MTGEQIITLGLQKRYTRSVIEQKKKQLRKVFLDELFYRFKNSLDRDYKKFKTPKSNYLKQKTRIIRGKAKGKLARQYKSSKSIFKATKRSDTGRLTGYLADAMDVRIGTFNYPDANRKGNVKVTFFLNASKIKNKRKRRELQQQVKGLEKKGYKVFGFGKKYPQRLVKQLAMILKLIL